MSVEGAPELGRRSVSPHGGREGSRRIPRATGTGALGAPRRRVTGSVLDRFGGTRARLSERDEVKASTHRRTPVRSRWR